MSEEALVRNCAPTLAGLKTGSMFTCPFESRDALLASLRSFNERLRKKGLRILPLRISDRKALLYLYRPARLFRDLASAEAAAVLNRCGYDPDNRAGCLRTLCRRIRTEAHFPHEVGLFLGYPVEDVCGFMENNSCNCKCVGCWKVYGDVEAAKKKFAQYKKCTRIYCDRWAQGADIERLTVAG